MPKDLKDQLQAWSVDNDTPLPSTKPLTPKQIRLAKVEAAAEERRRAREAEATREANMDDSDLFARAVAGIDNKAVAILNKYDATPGASREGAPETGRAAATPEEDDRPRVDPDAALFLDAVADIPKHRQGSDHDD